MSGNCVRNFADSGLIHHLQPLPATQAFPLQHNSVIPDTHREQEHPLPTLDQRRHETHVHEQFVSIHQIFPSIVFLISLPHSHRQTLQQVLS